MKIVIADDEELILSSLTSMIRELGGGWEISGTALDGRGMLTAVEQHRPEAALVDIRMPEMDGLEAIAKGTRLSPHTEWIVMSGYSEFKYAQKAIRMGVTDYLLKPVSLQDLKKVLEVVRSTQEQRHQAASKEFERIVISLCNGVELEKKEGDAVLDSDKTLQCAVCCIDSTLEEGEREIRIKEMMQQARHEWEREASRGTMAVFARPNGNIVFVSLCEPDAIGAGSARIERIWRRLSRQFQTPQWAMTLFYHMNGCDLARFPSLMRQMESRFHIRAVKGINRHWHWEQLCKDDAAEGDLVGNLLMQLARSYAHASYAQYMHALEALRSSAEAANLLGQRSPRQAAAAFLSAATGAVLDPDDSLARWWDILQAAGRRILDQISKGEKSLDLVQMAIKYMEENYMYNIGTSQIAADLNVTPNHLCNVFKQKEGVSVLKQLTKVRMLKAQELLLANPQLQVQEVAEKVGYYSARHFTKLFTAFTGCYPSEFKRKFE